MYCKHDTLQYETEDTHKANRLIAKLMARNWPKDQSTGHGLTTVPQIIHNVLQLKHRPKLTLLAPGSR